MPCLSYVYWSISPTLFNVGPLRIHWYGVLFAMALLCGYLIARWEFRVEGKSEKSLESLFYYMVIGTFIGARLGHCLFYQPEYYLHHPLEILKIWKGGLASHGGAVGILLAIYFYKRRYPDQDYLWVLDKIAAPVALGGCLIRVGNLFNSEILGVPTSVPWAFVFLKVDSVPRHPVQIYEATSYLLIFVVLIAIFSEKRTQTPRGLLFGFLLVSVFTARFFLEFLKQRQADYEQNLPLSVGQWLSVPFVIYGGVLLWRAVREGRSKLEEAGTPLNSSKTQ